MGDKFDNKKKNDANKKKVSPANDQLGENNSEIKPGSGKTNKNTCK